MKRCVSFLRRRTMLCLAALAVAGVAAFALRLYGAQAVQTGSWGLSFRTEGAAPIGTVSQHVLADYDAAYMGNEKEKVIYLTFDLGYEAGYTPAILEALKEAKVPAAFFVVGNYLETQPDLVKRMADEGHIVGNHTWHHYDMSKLTDPAVFAKELTDVAEGYKAITGAEMPRYYRPPQGLYSEENLKMAQELGYKTVFWSLAYVDWEQNKQPTKEEAFSKLIPRMHNGCVLLLHATSKTNAEILPELIEEYRSLGYRFAPLGELFEK